MANSKLVQNVIDKIDQPTVSKATYFHRQKDPNWPTCSALTQKGKPCTKPVQHHSIYCGTHQPEDPE